MTRLSLSPIIFVMSVGLCLTEEKRYLMLGSGLTATTASWAVILLLGKACLLGFAHKVGSVHTMLRFIVAQPLHSGYATDFMGKAGRIELWVNHRDEDLLAEKEARRRKKKNT